MKYNYGLRFHANQFVTTVVFFILATLAFSMNPVAADTIVWSFRGGAGVGPENTIEAMNLAFDLGASGTEIDIWHAGVTIGPPVVPEIMVCHYRNVAITTNGKGCIQNLAPDYLRTLDAGSSNGGTLFPGAKMPFFDEVLDLTKARDKDLMIHIKTSPFGLPGTVPTSEIANALAHSDFPEDNIYTWDHDHTRITEYVAGIPNLQVIYQGDIDPATVVWQDLIDLGVKGIQVRLDNQQFGGETFNQAFIDDIHAQGLFAFINNANTNEFRDAIEWGVDIVMTSNVATFVQILADETRILGDVNLDGVVNLLDVEPFVDILASGGFQAEADINEDGLVNLLDVNGFIVILMGR